MSEEEGRERERERERGRVISKSFSRKSILFLKNRISGKKCGQTIECDYVLTCAGLQSGNYYFPNSLAMSFSSVCMYVSVCLYRY
jgi:hypothetical protein